MMYDVIVVGAGHAGIEACLAPARMNKKTLLITSNFSNAGSMPCNTSIGGPAKGIIVREIDALGGQMGLTADHTYLQMKMLNTAKGPGVQSLRAQADKKAYPHYMQKVLKEQENLDIVEAMVEDLIIEDQTVKGVILEDGTRYDGKTVVLGIRPEDVHDSQAFISNSPDSVIKSKIKVYELLGAEVFLYFDLEGTQMTARVNPRTTLRTGDDAIFALDMEKIHLFDKDTELTITN